MCSRAEVIRISFDDAIVHRCITAYMADVLSWEEALMTAVAELARDRKRLTDQLLEARAAQPIRHGIPTAQ